MTESKRSAAAANASVRNASFKNGIILALFALISTGTIAITHLITKDRIASEIESATARRLNQIIPANEYDNDVYHDCTIVSDLEYLGADNLKVYRARQQNKDYATFVSSITPDGYAGKIKLLVGIYSDGTLAGVRVTEHQETPGLGDKIEIEKSNWIEQFEGKSLSNPAKKNWLVKKDGGEFDAMTGATITPRAIIKSIYLTLEFFAKNKQQLFTAASHCGSAK